MRKRTRQKFYKNKASITNRQINSILSLRDDLKALEQRAEETKINLMQLEKQLYKLLVKGASTEKLNWNILPRVIERRFPAWKKWFIKYKGEKLAEKIMSQTPAVKYYSVTITKKLKIFD